jgi:thioredoxin 1
MSKLITVTDDNFNDVVIKAKFPVIVYYWAVWCGPCKTQGPIMEALSDQYNTQVVFAKINADESPNAAQFYGVLGLPAIHIFTNGEMVGSFQGAQTKRKLAEVLDRVLEP